MKTITALVFVFLAATGRAADAPKVVATTPDLAAVAKTVAGTIERALCAANSDRCREYEANLGRFREAVDAKMAAWQAALSSVKGTKVVTYHKDFDYFFERFGMTVVGTLEPKSDI